MRSLSRRLLLGGGIGLVGAKGPRAKAAGQGLKVALIMSGSIGDGGWNQLAYDGLVELSHLPGVRVGYAEDVQQAQVIEMSRGYADDGYGLVIGHGFEFGSVFPEIASDYPDCRFFVTAFRPSGPIPGNVEFVDCAYYALAYGAGVLAALISERRRAVGFVGGQDNPGQRRMLQAFSAGARAGVGSIRPLGIVTGDYNDASKGRQAVATMVGEGADVIWHAADVTGLGALQGAAAARIKAIGCYGDQSAMAPDFIATSFVIDFPAMLTTLTRQVLAGHFGGGTEWRPSVDLMWTLRYGVLRFNPRLVSSASASAFEAVWRDLAAGRIDPLGGQP